MSTIFWVVAAFVSGALPLAYWLGRAALGVDIRTYGDGNPGAANVFRAGGKGWGSLAILLEFLKGALPVGLAHYAGGLAGWPLVLTALAPILGHAYSPFLGWRGGKALSVTFGVWCGLSLYVVPIVLGIALAVWLAVLVVEGWAVLLGMFSLAAFFLASRPPWEWWAVWTGSLLLFIWKHRADFARSRRLDRGILGRWLHHGQPIDKPRHRA